MKRVTTSQTGHRSIQSFFSAQAKKQERKVACPICSVEVAYKDINKHLDSCTATIPDDEVKIVEHKSVESTVKNGGNKPTEKETNGTKEIQKKRKATETSVSAKKLKTETDDFSDDDDFLEAVESGEEVASSQGSASSWSQDTIKSLSQDANKRESALEIDFSSSQVVKLSPSISYNPAKYGGLDAISPKGAVIVRSTSFTAAQKYSPRKRASNGNHFNGEQGDPVKRKLFDRHPDIPQHDPFTPTKRRDPNYVPYYVTNFEYIIACVIDCTDDWELFSDEELKIINTYRNLPLAARRLYVRLFNRKHAWIPESNIRYDECPNVEEDAKLLVDSKLLQNKMELEDLEESLNILLTPDIKLIAKEFNVSTKFTSKADIVQELKKMCSKKSIFQTSSTLQIKVVKRARSLGGNCYRLNPESRSVLNRVLCLWGVSQWWGEREDERPPNSLTTLLLANQGRVTYPLYPIIREKKVFTCRDDLLKFEAAVKLEDKVESALASKDWEAGYEVYVQIRAEYDKLLADEELMKKVLELPMFLRKLTAPAVLLYGLSRSVELLEKMKKYTEAVELLEKLLETDFLRRYRGAWYDRLCLDLENHLKKPKLSLDKIELALKDPMVRGGRRLSLSQRIIKICRAKKNGELEERLNEFMSRADWEDPSSQDLPTVVIAGKMISKDGVTGTKSVFMLTKDGETTYCNVEELVREHYKDQGLYEGSHAEGAVLNSILTLLFWDIIYLSEIPDAFRDPAQSYPLDWDTDDFYRLRKDAIDSRLEEIAGLTESEVCDQLTESFNNNLNVCSLVSWDRFRGPEHLAGLVNCIPPAKLALILGRMIKDHRTYRSGLPDLTCWNPEEGRMMFVEVKGPGDRLSYKQILWIRFFNKIGVPSEVCHVDPTGSLHSKGFKTKSPKKVSPKKSPAKKRKSTKNTSDFVDDEDSPVKPKVKPSSRKGRRKSKKTEENVSNDIE